MCFERLSDDKKLELRNLLALSKRRYFTCYCKLKKIIATFRNSSPNAAYYETVCSRM